MPRAIRTPPSAPAKAPSHHPGSAGAVDMIDSDAWASAFETADLGKTGDDPETHPAINISAMAERTLTDLSFTSQRPNLKWVVEPSISLEGDSRLFAVLLRELLENAWRFTQPVPEPTIVVGKQPNRQHGAFFVRDNGIGLDTAFADKCFDLFDTAHPTAHEQVGMGIGLATARIIVERHRGSIRCESAPGQGATFFVAVLPVTG